MTKINKTKFTKSRLKKAISARKKGSNTIINYSSSKNRPNVTKWKKKLRKDPRRKRYPARKTTPDLKNRNLITKKKKSRSSNRTR